MPLVLAGADAEADVPEPSEARERARKIKPEFARGQLVRVAGGRNQAESELIQNLLLEEGIPSMLRRSAGFDVPDMLAAGDRDVLVPESGVDAARDLLLAAELMPSAEVEPYQGPNAVKLLVAFVGAGALAALIAWALIEVAGSCASACSRSPSSSQRRSQRRPPRRPRRARTTTSAASPRARGRCRSSWCTGRLSTPHSTGATSAHSSRRPATASSRSTTGC
jgi:hypothetical protein